MSATAKIRRDLLKGGALGSLPGTVPTYTGPPIGRLRRWSSDYARIWRRQHACSPSITPKPAIART
jgi:hypothetical protein